MTPCLQVKVTNLKWDNNLCVIPVIVYMGGWTPHPPPGVGGGGLNTCCSVYAHSFSQKALPLEYYMSVRYRKIVESRTTDVRLNCIHLYATCTSMAICGVLLWETIRAIVCSMIVITFQDLPLWSTSRCLVFTLFQPEKQQNDHSDQVSNFNLHQQSEGVDLAAV